MFKLSADETSNAGTHWMALWFCVRTQRNSTTEISCQVSLYHPFTVALSVRHMPVSVVIGVFAPSLRRHCSSLVLEARRLRS